MARLTNRSLCLTSPLEFTTRSNKQLYPQKLWKVCSQLLFIGKRILRVSPSNLELECGTSLQYSVLPLFSFPQLRHTTLCRFSAHLHFLETPFYHGQVRR